MLLWLTLTGLSFNFVVFEIPNTPEDPIVKWAFIILVVFVAPLEAFLYLLGCRKPLKIPRETYVAAPWRQVLGPTMHCAAGTGLASLPARRPQPSCTCQAGPISPSSRHSASDSAGRSSRAFRWVAWQETLTCGRSSSRSYQNSS